jgi:hypothetical protein
VKTVLVIGLIATIAIAQAQQGPPRAVPSVPTSGTASISGIVVDDQERPLPVRRAIVTLAGEGLGPSRGAITDDDGRFAIRGLPSGDFGLTVVRAGYITSMYGAKRPGRPGTPVTVEAGAQVGPLTVRIWRVAVVSGVVRDPLGRPAPNVTVSAVPVKGPARGLLSLSNNGVTTNAKGEYRIFGLEPGAYAISATPPISASPLVSPRDAEVDAIFEAVRRRAEPRPRETPTPAAETVGYVPVYYPGVASFGQAALLTLSPGQEMAGVDVTLALVRSGVVTGSVSRADGVPVSGGRVQLIEVDARPDSNGTKVLNGSVRADGVFRIAAVVPGAYRIVAQVAAQPAPPSPIAGGIVSPVPLAPQLWADASITVGNADVTGVNLVVGPGLTIAGKVIFESATLKPPAGALRVFLAPASTRLLTEGSVINELAFIAPVTVGADGTFTLTSVPPGPLRLTVSGPAIDNSPWSLLSALIGDRDLLEGDFDLSGSGTATLILTFTDQRSGIEGTFQTASGQPVSDVFVIAFPADARQRVPYSRRIRAVRPSSTGTFVLAELPPGEYLLAAVTDVDEGDWDMPGFLDQLVPGAARVAVARGQMARQDLRIAK